MFVPVESDWDGLTGGYPALRDTRPATHAYAALACTRILTCPSGAIPMWTTAYRDAALVEALRDIMQTAWFALLDRAVDVLAASRGLRGRRRERLRAALRPAVDFPTRQTLTASGLSDHDAASIAATFVTATAGASLPQPRAA